MLAADKISGQPKRTLLSIRTSPNFKGELFAKADCFHVAYDIYSQALGDLTAWLSN